MKPKPLIPLSKPSITQAELDSTLEVLRSGWLVTGPKVAEFEQTISNFFGNRPVVAVSSGTAALHLALLLAGVGKDDEVITTPMTFAATANVILMLGAKPVFVDIDPVTWNIDPKCVEGAITKKTKALLPVHFAGRPCNLDWLNDFARKHRLAVIEDAAQAFGASYKGKVIGTGGNFVCFSFHPMKQITTIEGGAIVLPHKDLLPLARRLRFHGIEKDAWKTFQGIQTDVPYDVTALGYKYNMSDVSAALGLAQLRREREFAERRRKISAAYISSLKSVEGLTLPAGDSLDDLVQLSPPRPPNSASGPPRFLAEKRGSKDVDSRLPARQSLAGGRGNDKATASSWNLFHVVLEDGLSREEFMAELKQSGVASGIYYRALHETTLYKNLLGDLHGKFPNAERFSSQAVAIPIFPEMTDVEIDTVINSVKKALRRVKESCVNK